ncbi:TetR/AcrR family transcriptional regulator [Falsihalocynthiibacter sp. BN13B15]|uniref:TetR/AcrR family transcriptional regulator n=1 Tax=Falsihalocynthiibacter sp. BN13B15 TaxID=3240871 RepID=UPI003510C371
MSTRKSSEDRKMQILTTTLDLAFEVGPDHVTTGMIAKRLGLTQPAVYKHYPKKEDIWWAATQTLCAQIRENTLEGQQSERSPVDNLRHLILGHLQLVTQTPALPEIMVTRDPTGILTQARRAIQSEVVAFRAALIRSFEVAQTQGHLGGTLRAEDGVMLLFGIIQSLVLRLILTRDATHLVQDGARLLDLQLSLFADKGITT